MDDFVTSLAEKVRHHEEFWNEYAALARSSLSELVVAGEPIPPIDEASTIRLLRAATIFSKCQQEELQNDAQDIAYAALAMHPSGATKSICANILSNIGNFPAYSFIRQSFNNTGPVETRPPNVTIPSILDFSYWGRKEYNTVESASGEITLTDFQSLIWKTLLEGHSIGVSAPTSAGKSFLLQRFLREQFVKPTIFTAVYLVPSRALISEVQGNLNNFLRDLDGTVRITSVPLGLGNETPVKKTLFVLTQERLQVLLDESDIQFDIVIVDEAQQISEGARGIVLHSCLDQLKIRSPHAVLMFLSPGANNSGEFSRLFDLSNFEVLKSKLKPVRQNLLYVLFDRFSPKDLRLQLHFKNGPIDVGTLKSERSFEDSSKRLTAVALELGKMGQSLVYADGPSVSESLAQQLASELPLDLRPEVKALEKFAKDHIHPDYALAETVKHGVAYHYGYMPTLLRQSIEENFANGALKYLVCTSTLLQGVNLPARSIFMMRPKRGKNTPIDSSGFWNLAGRAGRLGKDIQGNVFLVDYETWKTKPIDDDPEYKIVPSMHTQLSERREALLSFIGAKDHASGVEPALEGALTKIYVDYKQNSLDKSLVRLGVKHSEIDREQLLIAIQSVANDVSLPDDVISKNRTVSPFRQQELFDYFQVKADKGELDSLIPRHPASDWDNALESLNNVFRRIHQYLEKKPPSNRSHFHFGPLALRWMRGDSLPKLIQDRIERTKKRGGNISSSTAIRNVLEEVEQDLRFRYVQYTSCYIELLTHALRGNGAEAKIESIPSLPLYLELGASTGTMVSFIELGLSRITARELSRFVSDSAFSAPKARAWLQNANLRALDISPIIADEIRRMGLTAR